MLSVLLFCDLTDLSKNTLLFCDLTNLSKNKHETRNYSAGS